MCPAQRWPAAGLVGGLLLTMLGAAHAATVHPDAPTIPTGDDAYLLWDRWPYQRIGMRAYLRSTYDRAGGNEWADASHYLYQCADDFNVTLDVAGAGILYFVRTNHWHGSPWHYEIDGHDHIVQESSTADPLHPVPDSIFLPAQAFPAPLAVTWSQTRGSDLSWVPIGFEHGLRIAYGRTFYGTGNYIYDQFVPGAPLSRPIQSWDGARVPDPRVGALLASAGADIAPPEGAPGVHAAQGRLDLPPRAETTVWESPTGAYTLRALRFSIPAAQAEAFSHVRVRITWDDRAEPSVDAPLALFFGAGTLFNRDRREYLVRSLPLVIRYVGDRIELSCYFPMPFFHAARIALRSSEAVSLPDVRWSVRYLPYTDPPRDVGYFHATYRDHPAPAPGRDLVLLDTRQSEGGGDWSGSLVGTSFIFSHDARLGTLEGDPRFFFDDSQTPQVQGTGTEEWGGGGDYWGGQNMTLAFVGHPVGALDAAQAVSDEDRIESAYRFLLADLMPFGRNALIRLEHGGLDDSSEHYETIAYWYGLPAASLIRTDELDVGSAGSEADHQYVSPEASAPYELTSRYEWGPDMLDGREIYPAQTLRGRTTRTGSEFTLRIDPANLGVMLRRTLDYGWPNQRAEVFVADVGSQDFRPAGIWYTAGSSTTVGSYGGIGRQLAALEREDDRQQSALERMAVHLHTKLQRMLRADHRSDLERMFHDAEVGPTEHLVSHSNRRLRDDEFLLPRALTEHRSRIRVRVRFSPVEIPLFPGQPVPPLAWSELRYTAYSFVLPDFRAAPQAPATRMH